MGLITIKKIKVCVRRFFKHLIRGIGIIRDQSASTVSLAGPPGAGDRSINSLLSAPLRNVTFCLALLELLNIYKRKTFCSFFE